MSSFEDIKKLLEKQRGTFEEFVKTNDERLEAVEAKNVDVAKTLDEKLGKIEADLKTVSEEIDRKEAEYAAYKDRLEELEMLSRHPGGGELQRKWDHHAKCFQAWLRDPQNDAKRAELREAEQKAAEEKAVTIASSAGGGYAVPEQIARDIERLEQNISPVRRLVKMVQVGTSDYKELVNIRGTTAGWVGESGTRSETATPQLRERVPTMGELYAYPQVSEWSLDDIFFDVARWLTEEVSEAFAIAEGQAVISGNGTNKPTGFLNGSPVSTADFASPLRAAGVAQYIPIQSPGSPIGINFDTLIQTVYTLQSRYRAGSTWTMNSLTTAAVRKLKDSDGQYLWQPSLQVGQPATILGYPVETWEDMPDIADDAHPIAFGNWRRFYLMVDRVGMRMTRDEVTNPGFVRFYIRRREGGIILNNDAVKVVKVAES